MVNHGAPWFHVISVEARALIAPLLEGGWLQERRLRGGLGTTSGAW